MEHYFGKIKKRNWEADDFIVNIKGKEKHFYFMVQYNGDYITISDTCGRYIPVDKTHLDPLITSLDIARKYFL